VSENDHYIRQNMYEKSKELPESNGATNNIRDIPYFVIRPNPLKT